MAVAAPAHFCCCCVVNVFSSLSSITDHLHKKEAKPHDRLTSYSMSDFLQYQASVCHTFKATPVS